LFRDPAVVFKPRTIIFVPRTNRLDGFPVGGYFIGGVVGRVVFPGIMIHFHTVLIQQRGTILFLATLKLLANLLVFFFMIHQGLNEDLGFTFGNKRRSFSWVESWLVLYGPHFPLLGKIRET